jgi:TPR repeat protein
MQISRDGNRSFSKLTAGVLALAVMSMATGCASRPYPENKGGEGSGAFVALILPFVIANEIALYAIEKDKERDKDKAADAVLGEKLSRERRFDELQRLVSSGDAAMQRELAFCYHHGRGTIRDAAQAAFWYEKSAVQGFAEAQNDLGLCYFNEIGVKWDKVEACAWWTLAASAHDDARQSLLFAESEAGRRLMPEAFADFKESVRRRAAELRALIGRGAIGREPLSTAAQPEATKAR